jgi:hypothetical protein
VQMQPYGVACGCFPLWLRNPWMQLEMQLRRQVRSCVIADPGLNLTTERPLHGPFHLVRGPQRMSKVACTA